MDSFTNFIKNLRDAARKEPNRIEDSNAYSRKEIDDYMDRTTSRGSFLDNAVLPRKAAQKNDVIRFGNEPVKYFDAGDYLYDKDASTRGYKANEAQLVLRDEDGKTHTIYGSLYSTDRDAFNGTDAVPITGWRASESGNFIPFSELKRMQDAGILVGIEGLKLGYGKQINQYYNDNRITDIRQSWGERPRSWDAYADAYNKNYGTKFPLLDKSRKYSTTGTEIKGVKQTGPKEWTFFFEPGPNGE